MSGTADGGPSQATKGARERPAPEWLAGAILIALGLTFLAAQLLRIQDRVVVLAIGIAFLVGYAATRRYGLLVVAGIVSGVGAGALLEDLGVVREPVLLALGTGFIAIYAIDVLWYTHDPAKRWWPLIPGAILLTIAAAAALGRPDATQLLWPVALIVAGVALLLQRGRRGGRRI